MTGNGIALPNNPGRVGQGTAIEQSRAAAEVFASVLAAKQAPRDEGTAQRAMSRTCQMRRLAERAFFRFNRGGGQVTGPSVHLARELARCWGNIHYGVSELRRDDEHGQSEMQAFAWDLETNARSASIFIVPHKRDKRGGPEPLVEARDIYENNANAGARRVREAIFAVLPLWFTEEAQDICRQTLTDGGGTPITDRIANMLARFAEIGITEQQLVDKIGQPMSRWTEEDIAPLGVIYRSIQNGEVTKDEEFPPVTGVVTATSIVNRAAPTGEQPGTDQLPLDEPPAEEPAAARKLTTSQSRRLHALFREGGITNRDTRLLVCQRLTRRNITSSSDLTGDEANQIATQLEEWANTDTGLAEQAAEYITRTDPPAGEPE